jgi:FtsH-binding integral membrane protein
MTRVKRTYALMTLALALTTGMAVVTVVTHMDRAMAFATVITHEDQAVGGCSGSGC